MRALRWAGAVIVVIAVALQLVPYGRRHTNPSGREEPPWDTASTRALAVRACYDCHSNETVWPWYSHVAPMSWLLQRDVDEGRRKLNFSEWGRPRKEARESAKAVQKGEMPPWYYIPLHPDARLTAAETRALVTGLQATLGAKGAKGRDD
ncbi:MAG TPA: heme-binding domain-containing protein [Verrucomicrobiae bacterium]|jgi:mono/diheme cytochrome c family protein|nr:heme-binding domain-containing protein [Verrucomicrobiae bacterium]